MNQKVGRAVLSRRERLKRIVSPAAR
jgi:hypothetical protein